MTQQISEFDIFYISYDEPQKEEFWAKLLDIAPWAKRIDGVKGFDAAHKAAANASETDRFITVDGDNLIYPEFLEAEINIPEKYQDCVLSWNSVNVINGLAYGNGGLKLWTKDFVLNMKTHEAAESEDEKLDFCWKDKYIQLRNIYSDTYPNGSPFQAFRAGFREGVKMTLDRGNKLDPAKMKNHIWRENLRRLTIWATVGADAENGLWSIYGTRLGMYLTNLTDDFVMSNISDYDWFKTYFAEEILPKFSVTGRTDEKVRCSRTGVEYDLSKLYNESSALKDELKKGLGIDLADLAAEQSRFFKSVMVPPQRASKDPLATERE
jgi:glycosyltransferase involved in cell wall biosynthesis